MSLKLTSSPDDPFILFALPTSCSYPAANPYFSDTPRQKWTGVLAILIETGDGSPGPVGTGLTSLGIEAVGKRVLFGKRRTVALQIVLVDPASVHPQAETLVANELHDADRFIDARVLGLIAVEFVLVDEHELLPSRVCSARLIILQ